MIVIGTDSARGKAWWPTDAVMALDFVNDRYMRDQQPVERGTVLSFTRASSKLARNRAGNVLNFPPDIPAITDLGLSIEPASANIALYSTRLDLSPWQQGQSVVTGYPAPDGSNDAVKLTQTVSSGNYRIQPSTIPISPWDEFTASVWLWTDTPGRMVLSLFRDGAGPSEFQTINPTLTTEPQRFSVTHTFTNDQSGVSFRLTRRVGTDPTGIDEIYAWGGQVEKGATPSSPIRTAAGAAIRAADIADLPLPRGAYDALFTFDDGSTQLVTAVSGDYRIPTGLTRPLIASIAILP